MIGRQVGDFKLVEQIGQGGMGIAYRAEQATLHRVAVVKVIAAADTAEEHRVRFLREARLASLLDHPYAAHVYAFGAEPDGLLWIAMELVRGVPLDRMLAEHGRMSLAKFVPLFDRLCEVIHCAHEQGIIHRDIKPANVMVVRRAGRLLPKLLDFGIARGGAVEAPELDQDGEIVDAPLAPGGRSVTVRGRVVGSPEYMAPEQWLDATRASPRTDQYALAATAFELLTGTRPFTGTTVLAIAKQHARAAVPPVGHGLPAELDRVFARALAKKEADRYASVLELAEAVREIAHHAAPTASPTDFDEVVRDTFIQGGPQPLAETLLELAATGGREAAWDAAWRVVGVLARILAVTALAVRASVGERKAGDDVAKRVRDLVERGLDLEEWIALVTSALAPFAQRAQAHPMPELVTALWLDDRPRGLFDELLARRRANAGDLVDAEQVHELLGELARVLRACAFLAEYPWVTGDGELWMGPRRQPREPHAFRAATASSVYVVDADGAQVVELSPLVRIAPPAPGKQPEAFLIDGPAKRGARGVAWPRQFERHDLEVWEFVDRQLAALADRGATTERDVAPYRGLASFGPGDAAMFYGREREVEATINRLRIEPLIAVVGPSGVGKSSFVHAGVLPALPETWQTLSLRPGVSPLHALQAQLLALGLPADDLPEQLAADPSKLGKLLVRLGERRAECVVLVIDQLEEVFTQCRDAATRDTFARALAALDGASVRVFLTLRDDFLVRAADLPGLGPRLATSLEIVTLPDPDALRRILVEPLHQVGYTFENESLPDAMISEVREHPGALALLSFAAAKLWEVRDRRFHHIPQRAYDAIGGVAGALGRHAEDTLAKLPESDHPLVRELFRHLVTSEGTRAALRRSEAIELLGKGAAAERVIEALVESRLLVGYEGAGQADSIEVIHEALLSAWPRLVTWQREDAEGARLRDQLRSAARQWGERGRAKGLLWRGEALVEYRLWRARHRAALTDLEAAFGAASIADDARARRLRRIALGAVVAGLVVGLVVLQHANRIAERNARESRHTALASLVEQGRTAVTGGFPQEAWVYLSEAYRGGADDPNLPFLLGVAGRAVGSELAILVHPRGVRWIGFSRDGDHAVTSGDGTYRVWSTHTGALERAIANGPADYFELTSDGGIAGYEGAGALAVWDVATGARRCATATAVFPAFHVGGDGTVIVTREDTRIAAWASRDCSSRGSRTTDKAEVAWVAAAGDRYAYSLPNGVALGTLDFHDPPVMIATAAAPKWLSLGGRGRRLVIVPEDSQEALVWDTEHPKDAPKVLTGHTGSVLLAFVSPDGAHIATSSTDHTAKVWDADTGRLVTSLDGHAGYVQPLAWSPDGSQLATGGADRTARLWDAKTGAVHAVFYGHSDVVFNLAFDPSGERLMTGDLDGTARIFDARWQDRAIDLGHPGPLTLRFSGDGHRLLAVGHDGIAWVIDVAKRRVLATIDENRVPTTETRFATGDLRACGDIDAAGERIVIPTGRGARVISLADRAHPEAIEAPDAVACARFAPGGRVVLATADGQLVIGGKSTKLHDGRIDDVEIDPSSGLVATAGEDGKVRLVPLDAPGAARTLDVATLPVKGVALSHRDHGARLAAAAYDTVARVFDSRTLAVQTASHSLSELEGVDFSPDDLRIAVARIDGVTVFDAADGRPLAQFGDGRGGFITGLAFSPDGELLAVGDDHGVVRVFEVGPERRAPDVIARDVACHVPFVLVGSHLTPHPATKCE